MAGGHHTSEADWWAEVVGEFLGWLALPGGEPTPRRVQRGREPGCAPGKQCQSPGACAVPVLSRPACPHRAGPAATSGVRWPRAVPLPVPVSVQTCPGFPFSLRKHWDSSGSSTLSSSLLARSWLFLGCVLTARGPRILAGPACSRLLQARVTPVSHARDSTAPKTGLLFLVLRVVP